MIETALQKIGLTKGETKIYLALLELGSSTTGNIIKKSKISGSKVYEVLDRLIEKGLASSVINNNVKYFEAVNPNRLIDYLEEKKESIEKEKNLIHKIIPELILKQKLTPTSTVKVFTGWEGIKTANENIITTLNKGEEWLSMGLTKQPKSWETYFNKRQNLRAKKGIIHKHLINKKYEYLYKIRKKLKFTELKFLPENFEMPTSTEIYKNKIIIMILSKQDPMAIMIESATVYESFKKYFYILWKNAKK